MGAAVSAAPATAVGPLGTASPVPRAPLSCAQTSMSSDRIPQGQGALPTPVVILTDPGQDLDDEMALILARYLEATEQVRLLAVVTTLAPAHARARLARGTLDLLGLHHVPVAVGSDGGDLHGQHTADPFESSAGSYIVRADSEGALCFETSRALLHRIWEAAQQKSLTLLCIASLKDAALFMRDNECLFAEKTKEVVVMGGVRAELESTNLAAGGACWRKSPAAERGESSGSAGAGAGMAKGGDETQDGTHKLHAAMLVPDDAHNNEFDRNASRFLYRRCQELGVPLCIVTRHAAYACKMPRTVYDDLAASGSAIGWRLRSVQQQSIESLWRRACAPAGSDVRRGLPTRCNRRWFLKTFCGGKGSEGAEGEGEDRNTDGDEARGEDKNTDGDEARKGRTGDEPIWDLVDSFNQYDSMALLACVPSLRALLFRPARFVVPALSLGPRASATHCVIGLSDKAHGLAEERPGLPHRRLRQILRQGYLDGISINHHHCSTLILILRVGWDTRADVLYGLIVARALVNEGVLRVAGILLLFDPHEGDQCDSQGEFTHMDDSEAGHRLNQHVEQEIGRNSFKEMKALSFQCGDDNDSGTGNARPRLQRNNSSIVEAEGYGDLRRKDYALSSVRFRVAPIAEWESLPLNERTAEVRFLCNLIGMGDVTILSAQSPPPLNKRHDKAKVGDGDAGTSFGSTRETMFEAVDCLQRLYNATNVSGGITVVNMASVTTIDAFAKVHSDLFRTRTSRVVVVGDAVNSDSKVDSNSQCTDKHEVRPVIDPLGTDIASDSAAHSFYSVAERASVPLVVISRQAAQVCSLPRELFDAAGSYNARADNEGTNTGCGMVGRIVRTLQRCSHYELWRRALQSAGCTWFARTFCGDKAEHVSADATKDDVWSATQMLFVYLPLAIVAALPGQGFLNTMRGPAKVSLAGGGNAGAQRASCAEVVSGKGMDTLSMRALLYQLLFKGMSCDVSEFSLRQPPRVSLSPGKDSGDDRVMWSCDMRERALSWLKPALASNLNLRLGHGQSTCRVQWSVQEATFKLLPVSDRAQS